MTGLWEQFLMARGKPGLEVKKQIWCWGIHGTALTVPSTRDSPRRRWKRSHVPSAAGLGP